MASLDPLPPLLQATSGAIGYVPLHTIQPHQLPAHVNLGLAHVLTPARPLGTRSSFPSTSLRRDCNMPQLALLERVSDGLVSTLRCPGYQSLARFCSGSGPIDCIRYTQSPTDMSFEPHLRRKPITKNTREKKGDSRASTDPQPPFSKLSGASHNTATSHTSTPASGPIPSLRSYPHSYISTFIPLSLKSSSLHRTPYGPSRPLQIPHRPHLELQPRAPAILGTGTRNGLYRPLRSCSSA